MKALLIVDLPKHCGNCSLKIDLQLNKVESNFCIAGHDPDYNNSAPCELIMKSYFENERPEWCPLIPINKNFSISSTW